MFCKDRTSSMLPSGKWPREEKKSPIRYISSIISKWRIFPVINENGEMGPNAAHALTAELVQTRCSGSGWNGQV